MGMSSRIGGRVYGAMGLRRVLKTLAEATGKDRPMEKPSAFEPRSGYLSYTTRLLFSDRTRQRSAGATSRRANWELRLKQ
jgi:hypothetical protein